MTAVDDLVRMVREGLAAAADAERAAGTQAYMKSSMPYRGVPAAQQKRIFRAAFDAVPLDGCDEWRTAVLELWRNATYREERYGAIALLEHRRHRDCRTRAALPLFEELIVTGAWWDYVDTIASHSLGELLRRDRKWTTARMREWSRSSDLWKRRSAILCQLGARDAIDLDLLYDCIEPNLDDRDFFIRKAIGWALRQHAWTDSDEVVRYVEANRERLSPLSKREALKNVLKSGLIAAIP
ncbi:MAG: DNA alkylation repair protein [Dehalococcoidia bacterium]|nr:DNA alkylation repair protein [Dehalococcoidia bacterium]